MPSVTISVIQPPPGDRAFSDRSVLSTIHNAQIIHTWHMVEYVNVKLPSEFRDRFDDLNKRHSLGYTSFAEIIKECLRRKFEEIATSYQKDR